ncbi:MAG: glycoside hydrolase family 43 protein [Tannerellaceae bacterium]|jgi:alpha-N-arabinofuranosidase|nr:glycoside hydrolase family 43 protein [Tannerellaceae bacterium]
MKQNIITILLCLTALTNALPQTQNNEPGSTKGFHNPILPGFYPDPSVCRVGEDYYMVTSTFAYFPGIPIFHSKDLVNWEQIGHCLTRDSQLDLAEASMTHGLWAPTIHHHDGVFYMVNTNMPDKGHFLVTTTNPAGEWSDPITIKQGGIDPSLFWDEDGKSYFISTGGINLGMAITPIDLKTGKLLAEPVTVWMGTGDRWPEGPHIYKKDGLYYLMIAEGGGTNDGHCITMARSTNLLGPYEPCPNNPILTHHRRISQNNPIQAPGHGDLIHAHDGSWWLVCLGIRPSGKHVLGRETFLAPVHWPKNGWPLINGGNPLSLDMDDCPTLPKHPFPPKPVRDDFNTSTPDLTWNYIRNPRRENYSLTDSKGFLTLTGASATLDERVNPTFLGRRQQHREFTATTLLEFAPASTNEIAGITMYMNENFHYDFYVRKENTLVLRYRLSKIDHIEKEIKLKSHKVQLRITGEDGAYRFSYSEDGGKTFNTAGTTDMCFISNDNAGGFTGVYIGLYATGNGKQSRTKARYDWFDYEGK